MTDNVVKSEDINKKSTTKKTIAKKAAVKKANTVQSINNNMKIIVFESGGSYSSNDLRFTKQNRIQQVPEADAERLLTLDNFRLPTQEEVDNYFASMED